MWNPKKESSVSSEVDRQKWKQIRARKFRCNKCDLVKNIFRLLAHFYCLIHFASGSIVSVRGPGSCYLLKNGNGGLSTRKRNSIWVTDLKWNQSNPTRLWIDEDVSRRYRVKIILSLLIMCIFISQ
ncbi:hypothetical protein NPIL_156221 [Nephila pilipes]|uniref:Uncharacterized protein n=1 Tax=Nephila pilipes TaxID=299642 RepID=A0A8X6UTM4_NEPPI|nr:hypothetical protein NPIL_156221 [Nephila pilipes]